METSSTSIKDLKNWLGRIIRDIRRFYGPLSETLQTFLEQAQRLILQEKKSKNKLYSLSEPEVTCICKGKARIKYEFGQKVGIVVSNSKTWILNVQLFSGNPYDGHTLAESIAGTERITGVKVKEISVDKGYRGNDYKGSAKVHIAGSSHKGLTRSERRRKRRRGAVEPIIGHMKSDSRLGRCFLKGLIGDAVNSILSAAGINMRKLLRLIVFGKIFPAFFELTILFPKFLTRFRRIQVRS